MDRIEPNTRMKLTVVPPNNRQERQLCKEQTSCKFQRNNNKKGQPLCRKSGRRNKLVLPWSCRNNKRQGPPSVGSNLAQRNTCNEQNSISK